MDVYVASKGKNKVSNTERPLENTKPEENAQKVNNFRQNNNAPINQTSFIPVYTKKTEMCHNFPKDIKEGKSPCRRSDSPDPTKASSHLYSPPLRHKFLTDQNEKIPVKTWSMHARRRSVGFEDMTSLATRYGYNLSNYQRFQPETMNCNAASGPVMSPRNTVNSEDDKRSPYRTKIESESRCISGMNQNAQVVENENDHALKTGKASQYLKDKSSKRKSSLNRMDFVDSSMSTGNVRHETQQRNSSSDEGSDTKLQQARSEFLSTTSKRKHNVCSSQSLPKAMDRTLNEVPPTISAANKSRSNPLVRALHHNQMRLRQHKRIHSAATHLQKFSHSAGELESLTDLSETASASNKICLSAQEFDTHESSGKNSKTIEKPPPKRHPRAHLMKSPPRSTSLLKNSESPSHCTSASSQSNKSKDNNSEIPLDAQAISPFENGACPAPSKDSEERVLMDEAKPVLCSLELNGALYLKHIDSRSEEDSEMALSSIKMGDLDISGEKDFDNEIYISAEENSDPPGSDAERRPSSILRKKSFEKKELHGILKPPTDDKQSKTPPSILKHRESSEEKDTYQGDLHSILKKSTSEDESCNSGPDIRPILKLSTDDESPGGSSRPRPILKKRTSFSEECFYASYPNGELKPILKKTTLLAFEEQPRPILKSRRKSEDTKSTLSEFIASRPRAYSADMGIKPHNNETRFEASELNKEDLGKCEYQDL